MEADSILAELTNKIRWSLGTTANQVPLNLSYREAMMISSVLAQDALELFKMMDASPELRFTDTDQIRQLLKDGIKIFS